MRAQARPSVALSKCDASTRPRTRAGESRYQTLRPPASCGGRGRSNVKQVVKDLMKEKDLMQKANYTYVLRILGMYERQEDNLIEYGLVMEYMPHGSLRNLFDKIRDVPSALRFQILDQVALGMNFLHSLNPPIIHRDLKPANVLLNKYLDIQITDFGLSKIVGATSSTAQPHFAGTLSYMSPESLNDINYKPTKAYDVYSFGILIWTVFSGEEPYYGTNPKLIQLKVPEGQRPNVNVLDQLETVKMVPEAKELMMMCWTGKPEDRPSFRDCSEKTKLMFETYKDEIDQAVRDVQDQLKEVASRGEKMMETSEEYASSSMSFFDRGFFGHEDKQQEPQDPTPETKYEESAMAQEPPEICNTPEEGEDTLLAGDAVTLAIKKTGDYNKILNRLTADGIITEENKKALNASANIKEFGREAEKAIIQKCNDLIRRDPQQILSNINNVRRKFR